MPMNLCTFDAHTHHPYRMHQEYLLHQDKTGGSSGFTSETQRRLSNKGLPLRRSSLYHAAPKLFPNARAFLSHGVLVDAFKLGGQIHRPCYLGMRAFTVPFLGTGRVPMEHATSFGQFIRELSIHPLDFGLLGAALGCAAHASAAGLSAVVAPERARWAAMACGNFLWSGTVWPIRTTQVLLELAVGSAAMFGLVVGCVLPALIRGSIGGWSGEAWPVTQPARFSSQRWRDISNFHQVLSYRAPLACEAEYTTIQAEMVAFARNIPGDEWPVVNCLLSPDAEGAAPVSGTVAQDVVAVHEALDAVQRCLSSSKSFMSLNAFAGREVMTQAQICAAAWRYIDVAVERTAADDPQRHTLRRQLLRVMVTSASHDDFYLPDALTHLLAP